MIEVVTDNRNRAVAALRHVLTRAGGNLGENGSVAWQFEAKAYFAFLPEGRGEDVLFELALEAGADDLTYSDELVEIFASVESFKEVSDALEAADISPEEAMLRMEPVNSVELVSQKTGQVMKTIEALEELDDVQNVYTNLDVTAEALSAFAAG
jgi:transcriptional/translational regulatory protein YebC/TACO1